MNEEMRKEFEEWFCNEYSHGGGIPNYGCSTTNISLKAWKASREAMKPIKLPVKMKYTEAAECYYYNDAIDECKEAIEQAGYKAEP